MTKLDIVKRWTPEQLVRISRDMDRGKVPRDAKEVVVGGRAYVDLRGIRFPTTALFGDSIMVPHMERWDLSYSDLGTRGWHRGKEQRAVESRFVGTRFDGNIGTHFVACDFTGARLRSAFLGSFTDCVFRKADLRGMMGDIDLHVVKCDFRNADLRSANLNHITFDDCLWEGARFGGGSANWTNWIRVRPTEEQLGDTYIMTPEEQQRELEIERRAVEQVRREAKLAKKRRPPKH